MGVKDEETFFDANDNAFVCPSSLVYVHKATCRGTTLVHKRARELPDFHFNPALSYRVVLMK